MILVLSVRLLDNRFHGLAANGEQPNWPPSCFRLFQAIVAGNAQGESIPSQVVDALKWLEGLAPPVIIVPASKAGRVTLTYVLNNTENRSRTQKLVRPTLFDGDRLIEFAWKFDALVDSNLIHAHVLSTAIRRVRAFGWGIDLAIGNGAIQDSLPEQSATRFHFVPRDTSNAPGVEVRVPTIGSMKSLTDCFTQYRNRFASGNAAILESGGPLYQPWPYSAGVARPQVVFKLIDPDDDTVTYPQCKLVHIAGMTRHAAIETMKQNPPRHLRERSKDEWIDVYVAGHRPKEEDGTSHSQLAYVPLQSIGHPHSDPGVRRVMIIAPLGDEMWLEHLAAQLDGLPLKPLPNTRLPPGTRLDRIDDNKPDGVREAYLRPARNWASVTPVILPGHDDHKPEKTRKLIQKALLQSGIEQPCEFDWSPFSHFRKMLPAHKYERDQRDPSKKIRINYVRPDHLMDQTAVHLRLKFDAEVPGPITIGAGRHCGFGLMAAEQT